LLGEVTQKRFRADLFYRVSTVTLFLPPLRQRTIDIIPFAQHLLGRLTPSAELDDEATALLLSHPWPGNLRELRNVIERAVLLCTSGRISARDIVFDQSASSTHARPAYEPEEVSGAASSHVRPKTLDQLEREHIVRALETESGHVESAARVLGIPRSTLYQKLKAYGISRRRSG
ncbi:MAG: sigma-54-dependent Fis family transcriptional regulator, partial [Proteobacteria bacterium]